MDDLAIINTAIHKLWVHTAEHKTMPAEIRLCFRVLNEALDDAEWLTPEEWRTQYRSAITMAKGLTND